jgi:hypothetical protein
LSRPYTVGQSVGTAAREIGSMATKRVQTGKVKLNAVGVWSGAYSCCPSHVTSTSADGVVLLQLQLTEKARLALLLSPRDPRQRKKIKKTRPWMVAVGTPRCAAGRKRPIGWSFPGRRKIVGACAAAPGDLSAPASIC